jgi:hypothetical protein
MGEGPRTSRLDVEPPPDPLSTQAATLIHRNSVTNPSGAVRYRSRTHQSECRPGPGSPEYWRQVVSTGNLPGPIRRQQLCRRRSQQRV